MSTTRFAQDVVIITGVGLGLGGEYTFAFARGAAVVVNHLSVEPDGTGGSGSVTKTAVDEILAFNVGLAGNEQLAHLVACPSINGVERRNLQRVIGQGCTRRVRDRRRLFQSRSPARGLARQYHGPSDAWGLYARACTADELMIILRLSPNQ